MFGYLDSLDIPGAGMFSYVSFRALTSLIMSLIISLIAGEFFIKYMRRKNHIEEARDAAIDPYGVQKKGVPSMGGVVILAAVLVFRCYMHICLEGDEDMAESKSRFKSPLEYYEKDKYKRNTKPDVNKKGHRR